MFYDFELFWVLLKKPYLGSNATEPNLYSNRDLIGFFLFSKRAGKGGQAAKD